MSDLDINRGVFTELKCPAGVGSDGYLLRNGRHRRDLLHPRPRDWCAMGRNVRTLVIVMLITIATHVCIYLNGESPEPCEPRVIIKRELVTEAPRRNPPPPPPKPFDHAKKEKPDPPAAPVCSCPGQQKPAGQQAPDQSKASLGGNGLLYKEIKPTTFKAGDPKKLFILGYQRVGSSFFGQMFDENPEFFYIYEPLDAVYTEMYATRGGLNIPSDITYHTNGTRRTVMEEENTKVTRLLSDILDCKVDKLPEAFMLHRFWDYLVDSYMPSWNPYRTCLNKTGILTAREDCLARHLTPICPNRLGVNQTDQDVCRKMFSELERFGRHQGPKIQPYIKYQDCVHEAYAKGTQCFDLYKEKCTKSHLWATKTVRGTMEQAEKLMAENPNMRLIHLIRDPRPVVTSRSVDNTYRSVYSGIETVEGGDKAKEATIYCGTLVKDLYYRQKLEKLYPGRIIQVIYEDFVQNPVEYAKAIYAFLDEKVPDALLPWIKAQTTGERWKNNAMVRMNAWKTRMTFKEGERVQENCKQFYKLVPYDWPY